MQTLDRHPAYDTTDIVALTEQIRALHGLDLQDILLDVDEQPELVVAGDQLTLESGPSIDVDLINNAIKNHLSPSANTRFQAEMDADGRFVLEDGSSVRVHAFRSGKNPALSLRLQPPHPRRWEDTGLPDNFLKLLDKPQGLIIYSGPFGHAKSSTMHASLDFLNRRGTRRRHILTIEDPQEYTHTGNMCRFHQRELGYSAHSYVTAIRGAQRVRPDVIVVGELRDRETIAATMTAATLSRLIMTTTHAPTSAETITRITQSTPANERDETIEILSQTLLAIVNLRLIPFDGPQRQEGDPRQLLAYEILTFADQEALKNNIKDPDALRDIQSYIDKDTSVLLEDTLSRFYREHKISEATALHYAVDTARLRL